MASEIWKSPTLKPNAPGRRPDRFQPTRCAPGSRHHTRSTICYAAAPGAKLSPLSALTIVFLLGTWHRQVYICSYCEWLSAWWLYHPATASQQLLPVAALFMDPDPCIEPTRGGPLNFESPGLIFFFFFVCLLVAVGEILVLFWKRGSKNMLDVLLPVNRVVSMEMI